MATVITTDERNFGDIINIFLDLINTALPVVVGLALLVFFWGLVKFIFRIGGGDGNEKAVEEGKKLMIWGIIALFILVSFMAIIALISGDLGLQDFGTILLPVEPAV